MEVQPTPARRLDWPGASSAHPRDAAQDAKVAQQFEALIIESLLHAARAARLGDDGLGASGDTVRDLVDRQRAAAIARAAPIGIARLLAAEGQAGRA